MSDLNNFFAWVTKERRVTLKGDVPGHEFHGNQYDSGGGSGGGGSENSGGVDAGERLHSDLSKSINGYGENGVSVTRGVDNDTHHKYIVRAESPTVKKRLEGKLQRRLSHGGFAELQHLDQRSFMIKVPKDKARELYK